MIIHFKAFPLVLLVQMVFNSCNTASAQLLPKYYLVKAGQMYDSEKNVFVKDQQILIKGNLIMKVGQSLDVPENTEVLDYRNFTITPGLIDSHTHILTNQGLNEDLSIDAVMNSSESRVLRAAYFADSYLNAGFTTIRDLGNSGQYLDVEVKNAIEKGYIKGPRMLVSGPIIGSMDGQFYHLPVKDFQRISEQEQTMISGVEEAKKAVKEHIVQGVDVIKILAIGNRLTLSLDEMKAIVQTAHEQRLKVTVHCDRDWAVQAAIEAGVDGVEHGYGFRDTTLKIMAKKGIYLVPTYGSVKGAVHYHEIMNLKYNIEDIRNSLERRGKDLIRASQLGVRIVAGSDAYHDTKMPRGDDAKQTIWGYYDYGLSARRVENCNC